MGIIVSKSGVGNFEKGWGPTPAPPPKSAIDIPSYWAQYIIKYRNIQRNAVKQIYIHTGVDVLSLVKIL